MILDRRLQSIFRRGKFPNHKLRRVNIFKKLFWIDCIKISPEFVPWLVDLCELKQRLSKLAPCLEFGTSRLSEEASTWRIHAFLFLTEFIQAVGRNHMRWQNFIVIENSTWSGRNLNIENNTVSFLLDTVRCFDEV